MMTKIKAISNEINFDKSIPKHLRKKLAGYCYKNDIAPNKVIVSVLSYYLKYDGKPQSFSFEI